MPTLDLLQEEIVREERAVGIRPGAPVSAGAIRRRRRQLELVAMLVFFGLVMTTLRAQVWTSSHDSIIDPAWLRAGMITCAGGFIAYALEKEKHLRKLTLLDMEARRTNLFVADAILRSAALSDDLELMHATLSLDDVVERVAGCALRRLDAAETAVRLLSGGGELPVVSSKVGRHGPVVAHNRSAHAEQVALARLPRRRDADETSAALLAAPLVHYGRLLGTLEAVAPADRRFDNVDLAVLTALAERAAVAIGHARAYREMSERAELAAGEA